MIDYNVIFHSAYLAGDIEVQRLLHEIEDSLNFMSPGSSGAINLKAEIDLALQPLRSENCDLRR